jgi:hypothetical protein
MSATLLHCFVICEVSMKASLYLGVKGCDKVIGLKRIVDLPFAPVAGMELSGITAKDGNLWNWPIESVCWDVEEQMFYVYLKNDEEQIGQQTARQMIDSEWGDGWTED